MKLLEALYSLRNYQHTEVRVLLPWAQAERLHWKTAMLTTIPPTRKTALESSVPTVIGSGQRSTDRAKGQEQTPGASHARGRQREHAGKLTSPQGSQQRYKDQKIRKKTVRNRRQQIKDSLGRGKGPVHRRPQEPTEAAHAGCPVAGQRTPSSDKASKDPGTPLRTPSPRP